MTRRSRAVVLVAMLLAATLHAQETATNPVIVHARINQSKIEEALVRGSLELSLQNASPASLRDVRVSLLTPVTGVLGDGTGPVAVGDVAFDQTYGGTYDFVLEQAFMESGEPLLLKVSYTDAADATRETSVAVRLQAAGGGL
jgi:hypothetical protein